MRVLITGVHIQENTSMFAISLDAWTSGNGYAFMAIVIHYIGNDGKLGEFLCYYSLNNWLT